MDKQPVFKMFDLVRLTRYLQGSGFRMEPASPPNMSIIPEGMTGTIHGLKYDFKRSEYLYLVGFLGPRGEVNIAESILEATYSPMNYPYDISIDETDITADMKFIDKHAGYGSAYEGFLNTDDFLTHVDNNMKAVLLDEPFSYKIVWRDELQKQIDALRQRVG